MPALFLDLIIAPGVLQYELGDQGPLKVYQVNSLNCSEKHYREGKGAKL